MISLLRNGSLMSVPALKARLPTRFKHFLRHWFLRLSGLLNMGSRVECPLCERTFRKFARFHGENDQCPSCGSLMRHRAILLYLRDVLRLTEQHADVVHVGPAEAMRRRLSSIDKLNYVSVDLDPVVADVQADVTDLPFPDESFDFALCVHVLEHVPDDRKAVAEFFRVLRPGSKALLMVPPSPLEVTLEDPTVTSPAERERIFGQHDHVRICGADYGLRLEEPGFDVELVDPVAHIDLETRAHYGLRLGEPFYLCEKPPSVEA